MRSSILSVFLQTATLTLSLAGAAAGAPGDIFVEFMARPTAPITAGTPGHAFFCLSYHLNTGVKEDCFGFYPKDLTKAFDGPGVISNEFNKKAILNVSVSLSHKVDKTTISKITAEINKWAGADYKLLVNNCGDFVFAIAKAAGLRTPNRQTVALPTEFVDGLKKLYWAGVWASKDPGTRFSLDITQTTAEFSERNPESGQKITKMAQLMNQQDGTVRINRDNTADVLRALGYDQTIIPSILSASPKPSFMKMMREGDTISADWNGLRVIKDSKGRFKELRQPGSTPAKKYAFDRIP